MGMMVICKHSWRVVGKRKLISSREAHTLIHRSPERIHRITKIFQLWREREIPVRRGTRPNPRCSESHFLVGLRDPELLALCTPSFSPKVLMALGAVLPPLPYAPRKQSTQP